MHFVLIMMLVKIVDFLVNPSLLAYRAMELGGFGMQGTLVK